MNEKLCIVTGAAGFIGSHLVDRLLSLGCQVIGIDNLSTGNISNLEIALQNNRFKFAALDINEPSLLSRIKIDRGTRFVIFHLAAIVSVPFSVDHPELTLSVNHKSTLSLLRQSQSLGALSFVFAGSAAEYGLCQKAFLKENDADIKNVSSPYGVSKLLSTETVAQSPIGVSLRFFNVYGPRQDPTSQYSGVVSKFFNSAEQQVPLTIFGDGKQTRDFINIKDVVESYLCAGGILNNLPLRGVFNVGTGNGISIEQLSQTVRNIYDIESLPLYLPERPGDIRYSVADISHITSVSTWSPKVSLNEGLSDLAKELKG